eukprot:Gb_08314 [translate_table: standard]
MLSSSPSNTVKLRFFSGGFQTIVTANPANLEHVLKTHFDIYPKGDHFRFVLHDFLGRGIFNVDGELWKMERKAASYEFNTKSFRNFVLETVQWEIRNRLMVVLSNACERGKWLDLQDVLQRFAFDNICKIAFGVDPGGLQPSFPTLRFAQAFDNASDISFGRFMYPHPYLMIKIMGLLNIGSEKKLYEAVRVVDEFAMDIIHCRKNELSQNEAAPVRQDLLSRFMAIMTSPEFQNIEEDKKWSDDSEKLNEKNGKLGSVATERSDLFLKDIVISFMLAGRDTTSSALTWFFWLLSSHPRVEEAIRHEILQVLANRSAQTDLAQDLNAEGCVLFSHEELKEMHNLHAALCESMRLYPPVPIDSKVAAEDDVLPDGTFVKKGTFMTHVAYSMARLESIWGENCLEFRPERWLKNGEFVAENPFKFAAFHAGPRICVGKQMAFIQMKSIVASIIHEFRLKVNDDYTPAYTLSLTLRMKGGLRVSVLRRR